MAPSVADMAIGQAKASPIPAATRVAGAALGPVTGSSPTPAPADLVTAETGTSVPVPVPASIIAVAAGLALVVGRLLSRRFARAP